MIFQRHGQKQRLFLALWPPPQVAQQLQAMTVTLHHECGGRKIAQSNQHITVVFLGAVDPARIADIERVMQSAAQESFELALDRIEYRRRGGMLWARATQVPDALQGLVQRLRTALTALGFAAEARAFVPHITLLRDAGKPARLSVWADIRWLVRELTLVRSHLDHQGNFGARYEVIVRVPLGR